MRLEKTLPLSTILVVLLLRSPMLEAGWSDWSKKLQEALPGAVGGQPAAALSAAEITDGLKQALQVGTQRATSLLGQEGGFLNDAAVKIPLPESLQKVQQGLRLVGQEALADEFVASMNHAAEKAIPATTNILVTSIKKMSLEDARSILSGPDDAATEYFRKHNEAQLTEAILPTVREATAQTGVTSAYKHMSGKLAVLSPLTGQQDNLDLDRYVARKTLDGLFVKLANEEKLIRENPLARSTDLLKKVFAK